jgi:O-antigen ligase
VPPAPRGPAVGWAAIAVAVALAASPLADGYFDFDWWGALALGAMVLLVVLARVARPRFTRYGVVASAGLGLLLALAAASLLWAESRDSAWTEVNRLALYGAILAIVLISVRDRRTGRAVVLVLGSAALLASAWLCLTFLLGGSQGAFLTRRLNAPIGYINGTACLLVMGVWPWIAYAEAASHRLARAGALAGASLITGTLVLTQSRAVVPAAVLSAVLVIACAGGRTRRAVNLILVGASVAVALPWTLAVYSTGGAAGRLQLPSHDLLRAAGAAILVAALGAGALRLALSRVSEAMPPARRAAAVHRLGRALAIATALALVLGAVVGAPYIARQYRAFTALRINENASTRFTDASGYRYDLWRVALHEFEGHPLGGLGAGNYDAAYYRLRHNPEYVIAPHSLELQLAAELGVGGIVALLAFAGAVLAACWARRGTLAAQDPLIKVAAAGVFAAWLIDTSVDWTYDIPGLAGMAIVAAGLLLVPAVPAEAPGATSPAGAAGATAPAGAAGATAPAGAPTAAAPGPDRARSRRALAAGALALCVLALLAASVGRQYAATRFEQAGANEVARSPQAAIGTLTEAQKLDPYSLPTLYALASAYAREDNYARARDTLLAAAAREPDNYVPPALLAELAVRRGDTRLAAAEYQRALALDPRDPGLRQEAAAR